MSGKVGRMKRLPISPSDRSQIMNWNDDHWVLFTLWWRVHDDIKDPPP